MAPRSTFRAALVLAPLLSVLVGCTILDRLSRDEEPESPADAGTDALAFDAGLADAQAGDAVTDATFDVSEGGDAAPSPMARSTRKKPETPVRETLRTAADPGGRAFSTRARKW